MRLNFSQLFNCVLCLFLLSACEFSLIDKAGSQHLIQSKILRENNAETAILKDQYLKAYASPNKDIRSEAAYNLALIEKQSDNYIAYVNYLEEAYALGYSGSQMSLANAYVDYPRNPNDLTQAKAIYLKYNEVSATANMGLIKISKLENNDIDAQNYAQKAKVILEKDIQRTNDLDGSHSYNLAKLYDTYYKDAATSSLWYRNSLQKGNLKAASSLIRLWEEYNLIEQNSAEALTIAQIAANNGDLRSMKFLGQSYAEGVIITKDIQTAIYWYEKREAAEISSPNANIILQLARLYKENKDFNVAEEKYKYSAALGNNRAVVELARMYVENDPTPQTSKKAFNLVMPLANQNDEAAMKYIADTYNDGRGVTQNYSTSIKWYEKLIAAHGDKNNSYQRKIDNLNQKLAKSKNNNSSKTSNISKANKVKSADLKRALIMVDKGTTLDTALDLFQKLAVQKNSIDAMLMIDSWMENTTLQYQSTYETEGSARIYSRVKKLTERYEQKYPQMAHRQWLIAANNGAAKAMQHVAENYLKGFGIEYNPQESRSWYLKAANAGNIESMLYLANQFQTDLGNPNSKQDAFQWYKKAAELGSGEGQYQTGLSYARGIGITKNMDKAKEWLNKASKNGYILANQTIEALEKGNAQ